MDLLKIQLFFEDKYRLPLMEALAVAKNTELLRLKKGDMIFQSGEIGKHLYFLFKGLSYVFYIDSEGKEYVKRFTWTGHTTAPFVSLLTKEASKYSARCIEDSIVIKLSYDKFMAMVEKSWSLEKKIRKELERQILEREEKEYILFMLNAQERYEYFTQKYSKILNRLSGKLIASYISVTQETLSRIRRKTTNKSS